MSGHGKIQAMLYDFIRGELDGGDARMVADHLASCERCTREADEIRGLLKVFPPPAVRPSDALPELYWNRFSAGVGRRIAARGARGRSGILGRVSDGVRATGRMIAFRRPLAIGTLAASAGIAAFLILFLTGREGGPATGVTPGLSPGAASSEQAVQDPGTGGPATTGGADGRGRDTVTDFDRRVGDYFRRSKTLLVGMSNAGPVNGDDFSLDAEKLASRRLVNEARYLRTGPVDERSWRLMEDLDEIMIELANLDERADHSSAGMLRDGIKNRNLLFKLRMRETQRAGTPVRQAVYRK